VSCVVTVQPLKSVPRRAVEQRSPAHPDAGRVLKLRRYQMALVEIRRRLLGVEIQPVLRDRAAVERRTGERRGRVVGRFGQCVLHVRREPVAEAAPQLELPACRFERPFDVR
jgi:hypothetical protein